MGLTNEKRVELVARITAGFIGELPADADSLKMLTGMAPIPDEKARKGVQELADSIVILSKLAYRVVLEAEDIVWEHQLPEFEEIEETLNPEGL